MFDIVGLIKEALGAAREVFAYIGDKNATKYVDECLEVERDLDAEINKPYHQIDHAKIVHYRKEAQRLLVASREQLAALKARGNS